MNQQTAPIGVLVSPVTPLQQNCTIVWCAKTLKAAVIDPGASAEALYAEIQRRGLTLEAIWITHGHLDHAGGAQDLQKISGIDITGPHIADKFWVDMIPEQGLKWGLPDAKSFAPARWLEDGDLLTLGETRWEVHHCPGHTPGHVVFFNREARFAQVGDVLFKGSVGRTDFPQSSHADLINSIVGKLWPLGDDVTFIPGHGPHSTFGQERRSNPFVGDAVVKSQQSLGNVSGPS